MKRHLPSHTDPLNSSILETPSTSEASPPSSPSPSSSSSSLAALHALGTGGRVGQRILLAEGVLDVVAREGSVCGGSDYVVSCSLQLLAEVLALREGLDWPEFKQALAPLLPYLEVS